MVLLAVSLSGLIWFAALLFAGMYLLSHGRQVMSLQGRLRRWFARKMGSPLPSVIPQGSDSWISRFINGWNRRYYFPEQYPSSYLQHQILALIVALIGLLGTVAMLGLLLMLALTG